MTETTTASVCSMPGCDDPRHADGLCRGHWQQFNGPAAAAAATAEQPRDAAPTPTAPTGRLRLSPMHAVVRNHEHDQGIIAVYGVYGTEELAKGAADMLAGLGIPGVMEVVPFYEVTP